MSPETPSAVAEPPFRRAWVRGWRWFCWLPLVWFVLLIPDSTTFYREGTWLWAASLALLLGEVSAVPLMGLLIGAVGRLRGGQKLDALLILYPRSFLAGAIPAFSLFLLSGYFMAWLIRRGMLAPTPEFGEWLVSGRAHGQIGLAGLAILWAVRAIWLMIAVRRREKSELQSDLRAGRVTASWISLTALSALYLTFLLVGKEGAGEEGTTAILATFFLLLEGLAPGLVLRWGSESDRGAAGSSGWLRMWGLGTAVVFFAGLLVEKIAALVGWTGSWRLAPAPIARLLSESYDFDWRILANVLIYWLIRLAVCGTMQQKFRPERSERSRISDSPQAASNLLPTPLLVDRATAGLQSALLPGRPVIQAR